MELFIKILGFILPSVLGGVIGYFASLSKQKRDAKERFFYEVYPKRLDLYRRTFLLVRDFDAKVKVSEQEQQKEYALRILTELGDNFLKLQSEALLFGSREFNIAIEQALKHILVLNKEISSDTFDGCEVFALIGLFGRLLPYMESLQEIIKRESPADFIGEFIKNYAKKPANKNGT